MEADWYQTPKNQGVELITEPWTVTENGLTIEAISFCIPIKDNAGKFLGVVGIDVDLARVSEQIASIHPAQTGWVSLMTPEGKYAGHPVYDRVGEDFVNEEYGSKEVREDMVAANNAGETFKGVAYSNRESTYVLVAGVPFTIGGSDQHWMIATYIPGRTVMADANLMVAISVGIGLLALLIAVPVVVIFARTFTQPFVHAAKDITRVAREGAIATDVDQKAREREDEIGMLANAVQSMLEFSRDLVRNVEMMAEGDWNTDIRVRSEDDGLGLALREMNVQINHAIGEVMGSVNQVAAGANQLSTASQSVSSGATNQAVSLNQITTSMMA